MLPNLIVIGAQKCGTTSLHYYLSQHPQIFMSRSKELNFFTEEFNWDRGVSWYLNQFSSGKAKRALIRGEASPAYSNVLKFEGVPERIYQVIPNCKLIYVVGDPVRRTISGYLHTYSVGKEDCTFLEAIEAELNDPMCGHKEYYLARSMYYFQLTHYLRYFKPEQIMVVAREDLFQERRATLEKIFSFLSVDQLFWSPKFENLKHPTNKRRRKTALGQRIENLAVIRELQKLPCDLYYRFERFLFYPFSVPITRPDVPDSLLAQMHSALRDDVVQLRQFTGQAFNHWSL